MNGTTKQVAVRIGFQSTRTEIDPDSHLWFALAVSLALHGLFLTALVMKSHWSPIYHPAEYGTGSGLPVVQFVSGMGDSPAKGSSKDEETTISSVQSMSSAAIEVSEDLPLTEEQPVEKVSVQLSTSQEAQLTHDPASKILQSEPTTTGADTGVPSGVGGVDGGTSSGVGSQGIGTTGTSGPAGNTFGVPVYLRNPLPPYPRIARERGWEGTILLQVEVSDDGSGGKVQILESSGHDVLDEAAVMTVRRWRFLPARSGDTPIRSLVEIPIRFRMAGN